MTEIKPRPRKFRAEKREKPEFDQRLLDVARVVRVVAGGRRFSFRATVAIGDRRGRVGVGTAKGQDVSQAVDKAVNRAKKSMLQIKMAGNTVPFEITAKYGAAKVFLKPAAPGRGVVAGSVVRIICELVGLQDITGKILGRTTNKINNAKATLEALREFSV